MENILADSLSVQKKSFEQLKQMAEALSPEALTKILTAVAQAMPAQAAAPKEDVKEKDQKNMGRSSRTTASSIDLSRRSA